MYLLWGCRLSGTLVVSRQGVVHSVQGFFAITVCWHTREFYESDCISEEIFLNCVLDRCPFILSWCLVEDE